MEEAPTKQGSRNVVGWLVQMWGVSNGVTKYLLSGQSTLYESRLWDYLDTFCYITEIFIPANIYHHTFTINDLNTNYKRHQNYKVSTIKSL